MDVNVNVPKYVYFHVYIFVWVGLFVCMFVYNCVFVIVPRIMMPCVVVRLSYLARRINMWFMPQHLSGNLHEVYISKPSILDTHILIDIWKILGNSSLNYVYLVT